MRSNILISYLALLSGLSISLVAIYYSVSGLISIFSGATLSIIIMGTTLEISKLISTVWLKQFWHITPNTIKTYLITAIIILMVITSLGVFGFLAKSNVEQAAVSGDIEDKLLILNDKIKIQEDVILSARKALGQLDGTVDQTLSRSDSEKGAIRSAKLRQSQQNERKQLQNNINDSQTIITTLKDQRVPISIQTRKQNIEYGPVKFVAAMFSNGNDPKNLENAVRYVIILIVIVFDPLAVILLLCSQYSFSYIKEHKQVKKDDLIEVEATTVNDIEIVDPIPGHEDNNDLIEPKTIINTVTKIEPSMQSDQMTKNEPSMQSDQMAKFERFA